MNILITNDDGIFAPGLKTLARELNNIAQVTVVAPDREQSTIGTAITLRRPLRAQRVRPIVPKVETYAVQGTPIDCVIMALGKFVQDKVDLIISGINQGANLGEDIFISGTVSAAMQGYLRGFPSVAISLDSKDSPYMDNAAKLAVLLVKKITDKTLAADILLNVNLPDLPLAKIKAITLTQIAKKSHTELVEEKANSKQPYYWLIRRRLNNNTDKSTDIWALEQGNISITPLHTNILNRHSPPLPNHLGFDLHQELQRYDA
ncbi:5'/3'-nucleotidase SurE [Chloroflexota bacterium]